jgi:hypothetical protein
VSARPQAVVARAQISDCGFAANESTMPLVPTSATLIATMDEFEDTQGLSSERLYELLETGDAQERVFAIWALGLRSAGAVTMSDQLRVEPDASNDRLTF